MTLTPSDLDTEAAPATTEEVKSTHKVEVIEIDKIHDHPNADRMGIVDVWGYQVCANLADWNVGDLAAYIPPDSIVPDTEQFAWLGGHNRIRAKKLRGVVSYGLLTPAPEGAKVGDDVAEELGITHYEPEVKSVFRTSKGPSETAAEPPPGYWTKYDLDSFQRYHLQFNTGEKVQITEKIHGTQAKMCYRDGKFYVGSKNEWRVEDPNCLYWRAFYCNKMIGVFLKKNPDMTLYGEIVPCQKVGGEWFDYGCSQQEPWFFIFDLAVNGVFMDANKARSYAGGGLTWVPLVHREFKYDFDEIMYLSKGPSLTQGNHIREGIVIKPIQERVNRYGRVIFKLVSSDYLEMK